MVFDIKTIQQTIQTTLLHASCCHYFNVDFVLFHNVTYYTNSLLSHLQVTTTDLLNTTCTLDATGVTLGRLKLTFERTQHANHAKEEDFNVNHL